MAVLLRAPARPYPFRADPGCRTRPIVRMNEWRKLEGLKGAPNAHSWGEGCPSTSRITYVRPWWEAEWPLWAAIRRKQTFIQLRARRSAHLEVGDPN